MSQPAEANHAHPNSLDFPQLGVCSWSLQVQSIDELQRLVDDLGVQHVHLACGDPKHATWNEGERFAEEAKKAKFVVSNTMIGFEGEDYTTPETIRKTGGLSDPETRKDRMERLAWAMDRTQELGVAILTTHAGQPPQPSDPDRVEYLKALTDAAKLAQQRGITLALETGPESPTLLKQTLDLIGLPSLRVNFDPANILLYNSGDPVAAVRLLGSRIVSVHLKDARRPENPGEWGTEVALGTGEVPLASFFEALKAIGFRGPMMIEREVGDQNQRIADIRIGLERVRALLSAWR